MSRNDKFGEDKPENHLDVQNLNQTFNIQSESNSISKMESQVKDMRETLDNQTKELKKQNEYPDPNSILYQNIERANRLLDKLEEQMSTGQLEPRVFEVAGGLINAITTASSSIVDVSQHQDDLEYKYEWLQHKEKELQVKQAVKESKEGGDTTNNNLIVTSREDILNMIQNEEKEMEGGDNSQNSTNN